MARRSRASAGKRGVLALAGALCFSLLSGPLFAQAARPVPNFTGVWGKLRFGYETPYAARDDSGFVDALGNAPRNNAGRNSFSVVGGFDNPILKPWTVQALIEKAAYNKAGNIMAAAENTCWPSGVPGVFNFRHIEILQTPSQVTVLYRNNNQTRTIYLDRKHAANVAPSWYGDSVGHFEGDTLVVDTTGFRRRQQALIDDWGTPVTEGLHVVERYRYFADPAPAEAPTAGDVQNPNRFLLDANGKTIQIVFTVEDPNVFKKSWSVALYFRPVLRPVAFAENVCPDGNRDWAHLMPIAATPDF